MVIGHPYDYSLYNMSSIKLPYNFKKSLLLRYKICNTEEIIAWVYWKDLIDY